MYVHRLAVALSGIAVLLMSSPTPAAAAPGAPPGTAPASLASPVVVSELKPSGRFGATDEFIELRNTTGQLLSLDGFALVVCLSPTLPFRMVVFGSADVVSPDDPLLLAHIDSGLLSADFFYSGTSVPDDGGVMITNLSGRSDGVGLEVGLCTEGDPAPRCDFSAGEAVTRDDQGTDTGDNATDFACAPATPGF